MTPAPTLQTPCRPPLRPVSNPYADHPPDPTDPYADPLHTQTPYPIGVCAPSIRAHANALAARSDDACRRKGEGEGGHRHRQNQPLFPPPSAGGQLMIDDPSEVIERLGRTLDKSLILQQNESSLIAVGDPLGHH